MPLHWDNIREEDNIKQPQGLLGTTKWHLTPNAYTHIRENSCASLTIDRSGVNQRDELELWR